MRFNTMIFHKSWSDAVKRFPPQTRLAVYEFIFAYGFHEKTPDPGEGLREMAMLFKAEIDEDVNRYLRRLKKEGRGPEGETLTADSGKEE